MLFGPFAPAQIKWQRWREAPENSFFLGDGELIWKASFNERQPVFIPLTGQAPFVDRNWAAAEMSGPAVVLPVDGAKVRVGVPRSLLPGDLSPWPLGRLILPQAGELALAVKTYAFGDPPRDALFSLTTGRAFHDYDDGRRLLCFDQWELVGTVAPGEETVLARLGPEAAK